MAKGQMKSNKEVKKPKAPKAPKVAATSSLMSSGTTSASGKKK